MMIGRLNAATGSWGLLESYDQDTGLIPAPKYKAIMENIYDCNNIETNISAINNDEIFFQIFPNPASNQIQIKSSEKIIQIEIYNIQGELILATRKKNINIAQLPKGIYIVKIFNEGFLKVGKLIKE